MVARVIVATVGMFLGGRAGAEELDLVAPPSRWEHVANVRVGGGYDDNVLLSTFSPKGSAFVEFESDLVLWRSLGDRHEMEVFLSGGDREFVNRDNLNAAEAGVTGDDGDVKRAVTFFGLVEANHEWSDVWESGEALEYIYLDTVADVSTDQNVPGRTRVRGNTLTLRPEIRRGLGGGWVVVELDGGRQWYAEPLDDYWEIAPSIRYEWPIVDRVQLSLGYRFAYDWYDSDPALDWQGNPIPGTLRRIRQHNLLLDIRRTWGGQDQWRVVLKGGGRINLDNGGGYYDYIRPAASARVRYRRDGWEVELGARVSYYTYAEQKVGGLYAIDRERTEWVVEARGSRRLVAWCKLFVAYTHDKVASNQVDDNYSADVFSGGLDFEF